MLHGRHKRVLLRQDSQASRIWVWIYQLVSVAATQINIEGWAILPALGSVSVGVVGSTMVIHGPEMGSEKLGHLNGLETPITEDLYHLVIWKEEALVMRILEMVQTDIAPQKLHALQSSTRGDANNGLELRGQAMRFAESRELSLWHDFVHS